MRNEIDFYTFFSKYSLVEDYGFSIGFIRRLFEWVLPSVPKYGSVEHLVVHNDNAAEIILDRLSAEGDFSRGVEKQLSQSILALCAKLAAYGLDGRFVEKLDELDLDPEPFSRVNCLASRLESDGGGTSSALKSALADLDGLVTTFRKRKFRVGTTLHQTMISRRLLEYSQRVRELNELRTNLQSLRHWQDLVENFKSYRVQEHSLVRHLNRHTDLLALAVVENTSNKGEKYIADNRTEYRRFLRKAMFGGAIIVVFALAKLVLGSLEMNDLSSGIWYGLNYAICFIVVSLCGGIIATKQPAMTASTLAGFIDRKNGLCIDSVQSVVDLVRTVFRSQFVSIVGNFGVALFLGYLAISLFNVLGWGTFIGSVIKPDYLMKNVMPSVQLIFFAAVAGVFLATSGLVSGFIDNKVVALRILERVRHRRLLPYRELLGKYCSKYSGMFVGNLVLGLLLGTAFLLGHFLPFGVDIRHIAFSTANIGFSVASQGTALVDVALAISGALLIGLTNLVVSFSITLWIALKSRGADLGILKNILIAVVMDFLRHPLRYSILFDKNPPKRVE
ncbi:MAG: hypothetical protein AAF802_15935 [Planctomycetota bacterium]